MEYTIVSSHPHVVCLSLSSSSRCVQNHYESTDGLGMQKKTCVSVWLLVRSLEVGVPFHYALMPLKTGTRQKIRGDTEKLYTCTDMTKTLRHAHKRAH